MLITLGLIGIEIGACTDDSITAIPKATMGTELLLPLLCSWVGRGQRCAPQPLLSPTSSCFLPHTSQEPPETPSEEEWGQLRTSTFLLQLMKEERVFPPGAWSSWAFSQALSAESRRGHHSPPGSFSAAEVQELRRETGKVRTRPAAPCSHTPVARAAPRPGTMPCSSLTIPLLMGPTPLCWQLRCPKSSHGKQRDFNTQDNIS